MDKTIILLNTLLKTKLGGKIKSFYVGDPILIPDSAMPCIAICPVSSNITIADNARDVRVHKIQISLIIDARKYFNSTPNEMVGTTFLMETMSKELDAGTIDPASMLGVIRGNLTLSTNRFISNDVNIDYTTRRRNEDLITLESILTLEVSHFGDR
jgi:hypothetical protein